MTRRTRPAPTLTVETSRPNVSLRTMLLVSYVLFFAAQPFSQAGRGGDEQSEDRKRAEANPKNDNKHEHIFSDNLFPQGTIQPLMHNYRVVGEVPLIKQVKEMGCWATTGAMLGGWKRQHQESIDEYLIKLGPKFQELYSNDTGIRRDQMPGLMKAAGLDFEWGANYTTKGLENLLRRFGPLWFTVMDSSGFGKHATVVIGLIGTGDMKSTYIIYVDPKDGKEHAKLYAEFMSIYEKVAIEMNEAGELVEGFQLVHYP